MASLITRRDGAVGWIVFSNPARYNALTFEMWQEIPRAFAAHEADPAVRLIALAGDGDRAFVSGADISQFEDQRAAEDARARYNAVVDAAYLAPARCAKPVLAKIRGICMGGGLGLAAACDLRIAADDAVFRMPAARLGIGYGFHGMRRFVQIMGAANAADIFFSARRFDAREALDMGFVSRVVAAAELDCEFATYCRTMGENAPLSLMAAKAAIRAVVSDPAERDLDGLARLVDACGASADYEEGRRAFMEKRTPDFKGR